MIKRLLMVVATFSVLSGAFFVSSQSAAAINIFPGCSGAQSSTDVCKSVNNGGKKNPVIGALKVAITVLSIIVGVAAVIVIIISALNMATSNGDTQAAAKARGNIIYALVGIAIAALAIPIVNFVLNRIG